MFLIFFWAVFFCLLSRDIAYSFNFNVSVTVGTNFLSRTIQMFNEGKLSNPQLKRYYNFEDTIDKDKEEGM